MPDSINRGSLVQRVLIGVLALGLLGTLFVFAPIGAWTAAALTWFQEAGPLGWVGFGVAYVLVSVAFLPTSVLTVGGGFIFGPYTGFLVVWISENIAAFVCFVIGRYVARPSVSKMVAQRPLLSALDRAMHDRGFSLLVLLRHSPLIPFGVLNYSMSVTALSTRAYLLATLVGTALPAFLYVYVGSSFTKLAEVMTGEGGGSGPEQFIYWGGLAATVLATVLVTRATRHELNRRLDEVEILP